MLLVNNIMQSTTTQNDLLLTAHISITMLFLLAFRVTGQYRMLIIAATSLAIAIGIKITALLTIPSLFVIAVYVWLHQRCRTGISIFVTAFLLASILYVLPSGYVTNYQTYGNLIGPPGWLKYHGFEPFTPPIVAKHGTKNVLRLGFEFLDLDLPFERSEQHYITFIHNIIRFPQHILGSLDIDLEDEEQTRDPFSYGWSLPSHEDTSYWGILGFGLIWPFVIISLLSTRNNAARVFAISAILFLFVQAYSGPYDPWRGRYFTVGSIFAVPVVGLVLSQRHDRIWFFYVAAICILGCATAVTSVLMRSHSRLIPPDSVWSMDRIQQVTRNNPSFHETLTIFEQNVPKNSVVAVYLSSGSYEYPLFDKELTRKIIPIRNTYSKLNHLPHQVTHLLYNFPFPDATEDDIELGNTWYLRELNGS